MLGKIYNLLNQIIMKKLSLLLWIGMISILTKGQNTNPWSIDMKAIHVVDKEDRFFAGKDEPYMLQIGFRTTIGKDCSSNTTQVRIMNPITGENALNIGSAGAGEDVLVPDFAGDVQFFDIKPPSATINAIMNHINTNGLTIYGSFVIVLERDNTNPATIATLQNNLKSAIQISLDNLIGTQNFPPTNLTETREEVLNVLKNLDFNGWQWLNLVVGSVIGTDDDIIGANAFIFVDLPQSMFTLLGINSNQIMTNINLGSALENVVDIALQNVPSEFVQKITQWKPISNLIDNVTTKAQGIISLGITFGGTGYRHFYDNSALEFVLKDQSYQAICRYKIRGDITQQRPPIGEAPGLNKSICVPTCSSTTWIADFGKISNGFPNQNTTPRFIGDVNGDGINDVIGIKDRIWVAKGLGTSYLGTIQGNADFGQNGGWYNMNDYPRYVVDINNDNKADIVGFGNDGVRVGFGNSTGSFTSMPSFNMTGFGKSTAAGAWTNNDVHPRFLADVDGDNDLDIIGFSQTGVVVAKNMGASFVVQPGFWSNQYCINTGWSNQNNYPRFIKDVNGDGKADIIGFSQTGVSVSLSNGTSFQPIATTWCADYGVSQGWTNMNEYPRQFVDINADGRIDIVGFGIDKVLVALNNTLNGVNSFQLPIVYSTEFGRADGFFNNNQFPRMFGNIDNDIYPDLIGFRGNEALIAKNTNGLKFESTSFVDLGFEEDEGFLNQEEYPRFISDADGGGRNELIGFTNTGVLVMNCQSGNWWRQNNPKTKNEFTNYIIYPNPAKNQVTIKMDNEFNGTVRIVDLQGRTVFENEIHEKETNILLPNLSSGIYFISIADINAKFNQTKKLIIN